MLVLAIILFILALLYFVFWTSVLYLVLHLAFWVLVACGVFLVLFALFLLIRFIFSFFQADRGFGAGQFKNGSYMALYGFLGYAYLKK